MIGVLALIFTVAVFFSLAWEPQTAEALAENEYSDDAAGPDEVRVDHSTPVSYFEGKVIGIGTGNIFDDLINSRIPGVEIQFFNTYPDMLTALENEKIDAVCMDEPVIKYILAQEEHPVEYLDEKLDNYSYGFVFPKTDQGNALCKEFNEFLLRLWDNDEIDELEKKWFSADTDLNSMPDTADMKATKGTLRLACEALNPPFVYLESGKPVGYEIEIAQRFCMEYGYRLEIKDMNFDAVIPSITSGICDFGATALTITEERKQSVYFSEPDYEGGAVLVVKKTDPDISAGKGGKNIISGISESFDKNFIREDRYKLIIQGIAITVLLTVASAILGTVLAFGICMFRRTGIRFASVLSDIYVRILQGTPIVVLLMILYYVVLGKTGMSAVLVAIIGFALNFGAYVSEILRTGIESIDDGQREAALALGHTENQAFFRYIFPQAVIRIIPVYNQEIVSLLKNTSIVGYIAIQDLTKMTDIIRSRTYEAFFPLILTAVIYFIIAWIITLIMKQAMGLISPKRKRVD